MDRFDGTAALEWWANSSTCLGAAEIELHARWDGRVWTAQGTLVDPMDAEGMDFPLELDPMFTLRIGDDRTIAVIVANDNAGVLTLTEYSV